MEQDVVHVRTGEAARRLGVNPATLRRWVLAGRVRCTRTAGGQLRYRPEDLDALLQDIEPTEPAA
jgi:excisionase family DNA binding protein